MQSARCLSLCGPTKITGARLDRTVLGGNSQILLSKRCSPGSSVPVIRMSSLSEDYQFLQRSKVPTLHFQHSLPRLPIPQLEKSCQRYLSAIEPLFESQIFQRTKRIVEKFQNGDGKVLQEELIALDNRNKATSYISAPWFDMYLKARDPILLNFNPCMAFKNDLRPQYSGQVVRATNMLISSLRFLRSLRNNVLEPEVYHMNPEKSDNQRFRNVVRLLPERLSWYGAYYFKAFPLDMSQYGNLMNSTRIPKKGRDEIQSYPTSRHILIIKNGNYYVSDVLNENGEILGASTIHALVEEVAKRTDPLPSHPIGYLTTGQRNLWAEQRQHLEETGNAEQLRLIDSAIFVLVLDKEAILEDQVQVLRNSLYGEAHSRFYDKSLQLIVNPHGAATINFEHSWGDGVAVLRYFNDIYEDSTSRPRVEESSRPAPIDTSAVRRLDFKLDEKTKKGIEKARADYQAKISEVFMEARLFSKITKDYLKNHRISPDSVIQLAFQVAYSRINSGKLPTTYEACSTAAFKHGRTETVRPVTMATKSFVELVNRKGWSAPQLRSILDECSKIHNNLTKEAAMGQGFDRHLFALKDLATKRGKEVEFFQDPAYAESVYYKLSTSTLSGPSVEGGGFGAVVPDGFGVGYSFTEPWALGLVVSSYRQNPRTPYDFLDSFSSAIDDIHQVFEETK